jgi:hypothetical protein
MDGDMTEPLPPVLQRYMDGLKAHDVSAILATAAPDIRFESVGRVLDIATFGAMLTAIYTGFPDWTYDHDSPVHEDGWWVVLWRQSGTHLGTFALPGIDPVSPTGRFVRIPPQRFHYRIEDDLIRVIRPEPIEGGAPIGILQQIGVESPPL